MLSKREWLLLAIAAAIFYKRKTIEGLTMNPKDALTLPNVRAFLDTISHYESNGDYSVLYGGSHFSDYSTHPNIRIPFHNPARSGEGINDYSTAAGKYQINHPTWLMWKLSPFAPSDFSPASQDLLGVIGLQTIGALPDVIAGNFDTAVKIASRTWASMPYSGAHQNPAQFAAVQSTYLQNGGSIA